MNISERYTKEGFVWLPNEKKTFRYSDGDENEANILNAIQTSEDLSVGSQELNKKIIDWPTKYHLSSQRVNLLYPVINIIKDAEILEVGSGCGAITRYLAETGKEVIALEGGRRRSEITGMRCRDLQNVQVYNDNFLDFDIDKKFDIVTLIGVLECSSIYSDAQNPIQEILKKAKKFLKPDGSLIIAIENRLGLKYFAGAPEDHLDEPYIGLENRYDKKGPVTFGKKELEQLLHDAEFKVQDFLFAFPDYKFPLAIITTNGVQDQTINIADILKTRTTYYKSSPYPSSFSEEAVWPLIAKNNLTGDLANSFLVLASNSDVSKLEINALAYTFSTESRKPEFCKVNKFIKNENGYLVCREKKHQAFQNRSKKIVHDLTEHEYIQGDLYLNGLLKIVNQKNWHITDVYNWFKPWAAYLLSKSVKTEEGYYFLDGKYFDASPFNAFGLENGEGFQLFDLEWLVKEKLRLDYVLFRGFYYSFSYIDKIQRPESGYYHSRSEIVLDVLKDIFNKELLDLVYYREKERELLKEVVETVPDVFFDSGIKYSDTEEYLQAHLFKNSVFEPLSQIAIQFFWRYPGIDFSETDSASQLAELTTEINVVRYKTPINSSEIDAIRLDIGNRIGLLNIHDIKLTDDAGSVLWIWNKIADEQNDVLLIEDKINWPGKTVQIAASDDPYIIIKSNEASNLQLKNATFIEISISALSNEQLQVLKYFPSTLNYTANTDEESQTNIVSRLNSIDKELKFFAAKESLNIVMYEKLVSLLHEAQDPKKTSAFQEQINSLNNKVNALMKEAADSNTLILLLREKSTAQLTENIKLQEKLKLNAIAKELLETNLQAKEAALVDLKQQLQTFSEQVSKLIDQSNMLYDTTRRLETEKKELHSIKVAFQHRINELQQKHEDVSGLLKTEIALNIQKNEKIETLNSVIKKLDEFYEKKNAVAVLYNKLKGKKVIS
ncbi:methyltransferase domain-containing protein [Lacibacter luteus]|uniref:Methyltransferase domain-containing protein n=1 Tax=Lacibacter luteus TaxID=2508719 RepID=A0A4V1M7I8_9BACT|nr:methyltransferase [Lacibacter luteus]RXK60022.1 methyltransferase domain-containing protein [Lacibacter luteus]